MGWTGLPPLSLTFKVATFASSTLENNPKFAPYTLWLYGCRMALWVNQGGVGWTGLQFGFKRLGFRTCWGLDGAGEGAGPLGVCILLSVANILVSVWRFTSRSRKKEKEKEPEPRNDMWALVWWDMSCPFITKWKPAWIKGERWAKEVEEMETHCLHPALNPFPPASSLSSNSCLASNTLLWYRENIYLNYSS
jgi:hypothetical protein